MVFEEEFDSLTVDTALGQITILPQHAFLVSALVPGELIARKDGGEQFVHISGGFLTVEPGSRVTILADAAERIHELDEKRAQEAVARAKRALAEEKMSAEEVAETEAALSRSLSRLQIVRRHGRRSRSVPGQDVETIS